MMDNWSKRIGRFGSVRRLASTAAIAILAVSPAIVPMTDFDLDGVGLAFAEAVFGQPVHAQEPPCEPPPQSQCILIAEREYQACLDRNPWYLDAACWAARVLDFLACGFKIVTH